MDKKNIDDNNENEHEDYVPPPQKTIEELVAADQDDESLRRYKETLLGNAQLEKVIYGTNNFLLVSNIYDNRY